MAIVESVMPGLGGHQIEIFHGLTSPKKREEIRTLNRRVDESRKWIDLDTDALSCALEMLGADPLRGDGTPPGGHPVRYRFHDPSETSPDILKLRELHAAMDRAVLDAYGWTDIQPACEFLSTTRRARLRLMATAWQARTMVAAVAGSPGATAGPKTSTTKSSPVSSPSTPSAPKKNAAPTKPPLPPKPGRPGPRKTTPSLPRNILTLGL